VKRAPLFCPQMKEANRNPFSCQQIPFLLRRIGILIERILADSHLGLTKHVEFHI